jgi:uncharacterized oligopeptide transporter (OPT) family protein
LAGFVSFVSGDAYMKLIQEKWLKLTSSSHLPHNLDGWYYWLVDKGWAPIPRLANVDIRQLALSPTLDLAMFGAGGLMGIRIAANIFLGMIINFAIIVPWMIAIGEIQPRSGSVAAGDAVFGRPHIVNTWALWWGISIMVTASMVSLFAKPEIFVQAYRTLFGRKDKDQADVLGHIELPLWISWLGVPLIGAVGVWRMIGSA